jgi:hypothetical protein
MAHEQEFDINYWEDVWQNVSIPQEIKKDDIHEVHRILSKILPQGNKALIEIGCAPGSWLAYFSKNYDYKVFGIDNAPKAIEKTIENLRILSVPAEIYLKDIWNFYHDPFDVVFSNGFIEHFIDAAPVIKILSSHCSAKDGFIITMIPSMRGINRWISKTFRPRVAAGHFPIKIEKLIAFHEACGIHTLYCDYYGSMRVIPPIDNNRFSRKYPKLSSMLNIPFRAWSHIVSRITRKMGCYPKISWFSTGIIFIGSKKENIERRSRMSVRRASR